jgi:hypothetical protein
MKKRTLWLFVLSLVLVGLFYGCQDLDVPNENNPDRVRAIASAKDVESIISGSFLQWWNIQKDNNYPALTLSTIADVHTSSWGNWAMQDMSSEPRTPWNNTTAYVYAGVNRDTWSTLYRAISSVNDGLIAINGGLKIVEGTADNTARARAFAKFVQGISHGYLAVFFDKAFIYDETMDLKTIQLEFKPYGEVMTAAVKMLEDAIAICDANTFTIPNTWVNGVTITNTQLKEIINSFLARYIAGVARTPAERAAVNWAKVMQHAQAGVKADWGPVGDGVFWWDGLKFRGQHGATWTRADYKTIGITDKTGAYQNWLNTPVSQRNHFMMNTDDRRIVGAGGGNTNGTDFKYSATSPFQDVRGTYHHSRYFHARYEYHVLQGATGPMTCILVAEMDLLRAEGLWRTGGSKATIAELINKTRVGRGQLAPVTADMSNDDLFKWLKYEKLIETFSMASATTWSDRRGWGELVSGSILHFPVPGRELEILRQEIYTFGGVGGQGAAPKLSPTELWRPLTNVSVH